MLPGHRTSFDSCRDLVPAPGSSDHRELECGVISVEVKSRTHLGDLLTVQVISCLREALQTERRADHDEEKWDAK